MSPAAAAAAGCVLVAVLLTSPGRGVERRLGRVTGGRDGSALPALVRGLRRGTVRRRDRRSDGNRSVDAALVLDLVAAALSTGAHPAAAIAVAGEAVGGAAGAALAVVSARLGLGANDEVAWAGAPAWTGDLRRTLTLSVRSGASGSRLLRDRAEEVRRRRRRASQAAAQRLGVRVVLPLGLCALPGFAAWGVLPVVLGLASEVLGPG